MRISRRSRATASARAPSRIRSSTAPASRPTARASPRARSRARPSRSPAAARSREFRAYAPRARWIRTANDSYFVAMTYPEGLPLDAAADRHPRRDLGHHQRGLWRRRASDRRGPCRDGGCGARRRARAGRVGRPTADRCRGDPAAAAAVSQRHPERERASRARESIAVATRLSRASLGRRITDSAPDAPHRRKTVSRRRASSAGWSTTSCTGTRAACPDRRSGAPSATSARPRGSPTG